MPPHFSVLGGQWAEFHAAHDRVKECEKLFLESCKKNKINATIKTKIKKLKPKQAGAELCQAQAQL